MRMTVDTHDRLRVVAWRHQAETVPRCLEPAVAPDRQPELRAAQLEVRPHRGARHVLDHPRDADLRQEIADSAEHPPSAVTGLQAAADMVLTGRRDVDCS